MIAPSLIGWAVETFVATTLLMLLVLAIRAPVRKLFGPGMAYALWLLPVLRMLLPPLPENWREQATAPVAAASEVITYYVVEPLSTGSAPAAAAASAAAPVQAAGVDWLLVVGAVWALGAAAFLVFHLISHSRFCRKLLRRARIDRTVAEGRVRVIETDAAHGPLAFGIWHKYVAFPRDFSERYDELERDLALAHELGHHVRGDLIANWVALVVLALHWFNPVAWRAFRAFRADQEMACDALVLAGRAQALRHAYGRAIVKSAHGGAVSAACHLHTINELKGRLRMLSKTRKLSPTRIAAGIAGVSALTLVSLGLTASGSQAAERIKSNVERVTGVSLSGQTAPTPPTPPAAASAPEAPEAAEAPDAPPPPDGKRVERRVYRFSDGDGKGAHHKVVVIENGHRVEMPDMPNMPDMAEIEASIPDIHSGHCDGDHGNMVVTEPKEKDGKKIRMVICTNRIEAQAAGARTIAIETRHHAMRAALEGLRSARTSIESNQSMTADQKKEALSGIDEALHELEGDQGKDGNDN